MTDNLSLILAENGRPRDSMELRENYRLVDTEPKSILLLLAINIQLIEMRRLMYRVSNFQVARAFIIMLDSDI